MQTVSAGGAANITTINDGGVQCLEDVDVSATSTIVSSGGLQDVHWGTANNTSVYAGGSQVVHGNPGTAISALISGGTQEVYDGGTASSAVVIGGTQKVHDGGTASFTELINGGVQSACNSGTATDTTIHSGGKQEVHGGGTATVTTIHSSGSQTIFGSGTASSATINGGAQHISSGGMATDTTINSAGEQHISSGGTATSTTVSAGGSQAVWNGGAANSAVISSGGSQEVYHSGTATSTTILSGGTQLIWGGGTDNNATIGGSQIVSSGGAAHSATINLGGTQEVYRGGTVSNTAIEGGVQNVFSSGVASHTVIRSGAQVIFNSGAASSATIHTGGEQRISTGGTANATTINSGGRQYVSSGGTATGTTINNGGRQYVSSGGTATGTTINDGGEQYVYDSGTANGATVNAGGGQHVSSGGVANGAIINGGEQHVSADAMANNTIINIHGMQYILNGGAANGTIINNGGWQHISSGGTANNTNINRGGAQAISSGGTAGGTIINNGGWQGVSSGGTASNTSINRGGSQHIFSGGTASNTTLAGGTQVVAAGGEQRGFLSGHGHVTAAAPLRVDGGTAGLASLTATGDAAGAEKTLRVSGSVNATGGSVGAQQHGHLMLTGDIEGTGTVVGDNGRVTVAGSITAARVQAMNGGSVLAGSIDSDIAVTANGSVAAERIAGNRNIQIAAGNLVAGSTDTAPLRQAMQLLGKSAGLAIHTPMRFTPGSLAVGGGAPASGQAVFGADALLDVYVAGLPATTPLLTVNAVQAHPGATLLVSEGMWHQWVQLANVDAHFTTTLTDNALLHAVYHGNGRYRLQLVEGVRPGMSKLDPALIALLRQAVTAHEIGTVRSRYLFSPLGGVRFLSRIIGLRYAASNIPEAAATLESSARLAALAGVSQMAQQANRAQADAALARLSPRSSGTGESTGLASGDAAAPLGLGLWIKPLYQHWNSFDLKAGNYRMDVHGALGGLALGADYTTATGFRAGLNASLGGGYAQGGGELGDTSNNLGFWGVGGYAGWTYGNFHLAGDINFTSTWNSAKQALPASLGMADLQGDITARAFSVGLRAEYTFDLGLLDITPHVQARYTWLHMDTYSLESADLKVLEGKAADQHIWSFPMGLTLSREMTTANGWWLRPSLELRLTPYAGDIAQRAKAEYVGVSGTADLYGRTQTQDYLTGGGTLALEMGRDNLSFGLRYELDAGAHTTQQGIYASFRYEF